MIARSAVLMGPEFRLHPDRPVRSVVAGGVRARGRRPALETLEGRMLLSEGVRGIVFDESRRRPAAVREVGPGIGGTATLGTGRRPALSARPAGPPDARGDVVVVGRASPRGVVRLDLGADGSFEGRARADARGRFHFAFHVDYGTTPVRVVALRPGRRPAAAALSVNRPDPRPPTVEVLSLSPGPVAGTAVTIGGRVVDDLSGVAALTASVDGGSPGPVAFDDAGRFDYTVPIPIDGTADGAHVVRLDAVDRAGNPALAVDVPFTVDTRGPTVTLFEPPSGASTRDAPIVAGRVVDLVSGAGTLTAQLDDEPPVPVPVGPDGGFSYTPRLPLDGTAAGRHVVQFRAWDRAGNPGAPASMAFTLDAIYPDAEALADAMVLAIVDQPGRPILTGGDPGTEGNRYGFEGGSVIKWNGVYHLFTSEMVGDPFAVKMRLAHWTSPDRLSWRRVSTLYESSGSSDGTDPRAALWSPMPIYNDEDDRWELFYVAYRSLPSTPEMWLANHAGQIWRAVSTRPGPDGIGGPYRDVGVILQPGKDSDPWEGLQGTDSFYPYRVGDRWFGFYGSANTEVKPTRYWRVGLASAPELAGPWTRLSERNPVPLDSRSGVENPIVTRLESGPYIAIFDTLGFSDQIGYAVSRDGIEWSRARFLVLHPEKRWTRDVRTPLGLIPEGGGRFTVFYTGSYDLPGTGTYYGLGVLTLKLTTTSGDPIN